MSPIHSVFVLQKLQGEALVTVLLPIDMPNPALRYEPSAETNGRLGAEHQIDAISLERRIEYALLLRDNNTLPSLMACRLIST